MHNTQKLSVSVNSINDNPFIAKDNIIMFFADTYVKANVALIEPKDQREKIPKASPKKTRDPKIPRETLSKVRSDFN